MKISAPSLHLAALLAAFVLTPTASVRAADPPTRTVAAPTSATSAAPAPQIDPAAMALLKKVQTAMLTAGSYYAECWTTQTFDPIPGKTRPPRYQMATLTAEKPNLMRYDYWRMDVDAQGKWSKQKEVPTDTSVSDGKTTWRQSGSVYHTGTSTSLDDLDANQEPWMGFYSTRTSAYERTEYIRTNGERFEKQFAKQFEVRRDGTEAVEGVVCDKVFTHSISLFGSQTVEHRTTYYIGPDGLLQRQIEHIQFGTTPGYTRDAILRNVKTNFLIVYPKTLFTYTAPQGVTLAE